MNEPSQIAVDAGKELYDWLTSQPLIRSQMTVEVLGKIIMHHQILIDKATAGKATKGTKTFGIICYRHIEYLSCVEIQ